MKKWFATVLIMAFTALSFNLALAGSDFDPSGPAPNSGDCIPDGSGMEPGIQNGIDTSETGSGPTGPAPNAGDGIPDGSGLEPSPNGENNR